MKKRGRSKADIGNSKSSSEVLFYIANNVNYVREIARELDLHFRTIEFQIEQLKDRKLIKRIPKLKNKKIIFYEVDYVEVTKLFFDRVFVKTKKRFKTELSKNKDFHFLFDFLFKKAGRSFTINTIFDYLIENPFKVFNEEHDVPIIGSGRPIETLSKEFIGFFLNLIDRQSVDRNSLDDILKEYRRQRIKK